MTHYSTWNNPRTVVVCAMLLMLAFLPSSVSAQDFTIATTADFDAGTKTDTATETDLDNIDADELRINASATPWERWKNEGQVSGVGIGDVGGVEYRRAIKLNYTGEFLLYGVAVYVVSITGSPNDIYVALLEPDGVDCRPNGVSGVIIETPKVASGEITTGAYNYFNFTNPVVINQTACNWLAFLTDGANPTNAYYLIYDNTADQGFKESLQSKMVVSTDGGSTWGIPTVTSGIQTKVLTVNYTTTATWESDTISIPSGKRLDSIDITFDSRFAQYEYRAPNNSTHYDNSTWPTTVGPPNEGHTVHPDIVDMGEVWNNYRYWACHTPLPGGSDDWENPEIVASNDTYTFEMPTGITNPIWNTGEDNDHAGDCDLLWDGTYLRVYWFYPNQTYERTYILSKRTTDGITWIPAGNGLDNAIEVLNLTWRKGISPTVIYEEGTYYLWYMATDDAGANANDTYVYYRTSTDGENFTAEQNITSGFSVMTDTEFNVWHLDIEKVQNEYWGLFAMTHNRSAFNGVSKSAVTELFFGWSTDRENWTIQDHYPIIHQGDNGDWDEREIYRSTFLMDGDTMRIWYCGANDPGSWFVSYTEATVQTRTITQVDFKVSGVTKASYTTDIRKGTTVTISSPNTGDFENVQGAMTILLTFSSGGNATPVISQIQGSYTDVASSGVNQYDCDFQPTIDAYRVSFRAWCDRDDALIFHWIWDFGDGTLLYGDSTMDHEYSQAGTFNVSLEVIDHDGRTVIVSKTITIGEGDSTSGFFWSAMERLCWLWGAIILLVILAALVKHRRKKEENMRPQERGE